MIDLQHHKSVIYQLKSQRPAHLKIAMNNAEITIFLVMKGKFLAGVAILLGSMVKRRSADAKIRIG